jgi:predicted nucleotidyltransferase
MAGRSAVPTGGVRPSDVLREKRDVMLSTVAEHGLRHPRVFGSVARGTDTVDSDLDLVVTVPAGAGLRFLSLSDVLASRLSIPVDVVSEGALSGSLHETLNEAVPL